MLRRKTCVDWIAKVADMTNLLAQRFLQAGALSGQQATPLAQGTPQGAVFSPLFANVYLTPFDRQMMTRGYQLVRYGDDFLTLHHTKEEATTALRRMQAILEDQLKLRLQREKTAITDAQHHPLNFLNFLFIDGSVTPTPYAVERFQARVRAILAGHRPQGMTAVIEQLNALIRGWGEYFKIGQVADLYRELDAWIAAQLGVQPGPVSGIASLTALGIKHRSQHVRYP